MHKSYFKIIEQFTYIVLILTQIIVTCEVKQTTSLYLDVMLSIKSFSIA